MKKQIAITLLALSMLLFSSNLRATADLEDVVEKTTAATTGVVVGPFIGGSRGFMRGAVWGTNSVASGLGNQDGYFQKTVGAFTGGVVGGLAGALGGFAKGAYDGVRYGIDKPFSKENYSRGGNDYLDYDPFDWTY